MDGLEPLGRSLIVLGVVLAALGAVFVLGPRLPLLGHLPGDIVIHRDNVTIVIPITSMILISVVASVVIGLLGRR
jgi:membrane associated rhomboid family serine protease